MQQEESNQDEEEEDVEPSKGSSRPVTPSQEGDLRSEVSELPHDEAPPQESEVPPEPEVPPPPPKTEDGKKLSIIGK